MTPLKALEKPSVIFEGIKTKVINNEGVLPPQVSPVGGRLSNFVEGWKHIRNDPYILSIVVKGYRLRFTSPPLLRQTLWELRSLQDPQEILGMREQITLMLQKNAITEVPPDSPGFYSNVFLVRKASGGWHPVIDLKNLNAHIHAPTSFPYVHYKLCRKRRLRIQDRSAGCVLSCTDSSKQQEIPQFRLRKQGVPVSSTTFWSKYSSSSFYLFGAHGDSIPAPSGGFGDTISGRLASSPPGPSNFIMSSGSATRHARPGRLHSESKEIRAGPYSGSLVPRNSLTSGPRESFTPRVQGWGDSRLRAPSILPQGTKLFSSVPPYGFAQLGLRSYPSGSFVPETHSTSFSFVRSDKPVYATAPIRPCGPCQPTAAMAGPTFSYLRNPTIFTDASNLGWGAHMGDSKISGTWTLIDRKLHINCLVLKAVTCALQHWAPLLQGHQVMVATDNSTVVSYINKQGGTRSTPLLHLTVELFLWLESQDIIVRARHIPGCLNVIADHLSRPNQPIPTEWSLHPKIVKRIFRFWGTPEVDMFATLSNSHLPRFMSPVPEPRALAVDALSQDWQGRSMYMFPPFPLLSKVVQKLRSTQVAEVILVAPWWPSQPWFPHLLRLCVEHPLFLPYRQDLLSQQDQKYISDGKSFSSS